MGNNHSYIEFDSGLEMNTKYLTEKVAYFLGGILAAEESVETSSGKYQISPCRNNNKYVTEKDLIEHYNIVKNIASTVNGITISSDNIKGTELDSGKKQLKGFSTFFKEKKQFNPKLILPSLKIALEQSSFSVRRAFIVGMFDGRGSPDIDKTNFNVRYLSLDCMSDEIAAFFAEILSKEGLETNYNVYRERKEGGKPRNPQLRIKKVHIYMNRFGLISPRKFNALFNAYQQNNIVEIIEESTVLPGLKSLTFIDKE